MSAPTQKTNGLPVTTIAAQSPPLELLEQRDRRLERRAAERRRLRVVLAVVDGDERDRPDARVDAVQLEDGVAHWTFSQRIAAPMPMPMQSAVSP